MAKGRGRDRLQQRFEERNFRRMMKGDQYLRGVRAPDGLREMQEAAAEAHSRNAHRERMRALEMERLREFGIEDRRAQQSILAELDMSRAERRALMFGALYGMRPGGLMRRMGTTNVVETYHDTEIALDSLSALMADLGMRVGVPFDPDWWKELYPDLRSGPTRQEHMQGFNLAKWVREDRRLLIIAVPAKLAEVAAQRPDDVNFLIDTADQAEIEIMTDKEANSRNAREADIILTFGSSHFDVVSGFARQFGKSKEDVLPMSGFLTFCAQRIKHCPLIMKKYMATKAAQPVVRKTRLD